MVNIQVAKNQEIHHALVFYLFCWT